MGGWVSLFVGWVRDEEMGGFGDVLGNKGSGLGLFGEVDGWVGNRKIEENEAVRMSCWMSYMGGWVGGWVGESLR